MEALGVFGVNWKLLLIQAANFGVLLFVLWYFLYTPLMQLLEERQQRIQKGVADAEHAEKERKEAGEEKKKVLSEATNKAETIVGEAKQKGEHEKESIVAEARNTKEQVLADANAQARAEKERVLGSAQKEVAQMATLAAARILKDKAEAQRQHN